MGYDKFRENCSNYLIEKKVKLKEPLLVGSIFGLLVISIVFSGYGLFICYLCPVFFVGIAFIDLLTIFQKSFIQYIFNILLIFFIPTIFYFCSSEIQVFRKSLIRDEMNTLNQVNEFHKKNGIYPEKLSALNFSTKLKIYTEKFYRDEVNFGHLNENDAVVYMGPDGFICLIPVTKVLPISITRIYKFVWTSENQTWEYNYSVWELTVSRN